MKNFVTARQTRLKRTNKYIKELNSEGIWEKKVTARLLRVSARTMRKGSAWRLLVRCLLVERLTT